MASKPATSSQYSPPGTNKAPAGNKLPLVDGGSTGSPIGKPTGPIPLIGRAVTVMQQLDRVS